ncbi:MAG: helix-turn-helix transcriptional regulator [Clostridia bacterium]|nr:helix-turn-helix transcriptional regulator [Clostridia bacterium]
MEIGEIIRSLRLENKMTQTKLAELLFTSQDTISLWERNKSLPDVKSVIRMSKIFQVSTDYILGVSMF